MDEGTKSENALKDEGKGALEKLVEDGGLCAREEELDERVQDASSEEDASV